MAIMVRFEYLFCLPNDSIDILYKSILTFNSSQTLKMLVVGLDGLEFVGHDGHVIDIVNLATIVSR